MVLSLTVPGCLWLIISLFISFSLRSIFYYRHQFHPEKYRPFFDIFNTLLSNHITPIAYRIPCPMFMFIYIMIHENYLLKIIAFDVHHSIYVNILSHSLDAVLVFGYILKPVFDQFTCIYNLQIKFEYQMISRWWTSKWRRWSDIKWTNSMKLNKKL